MLPVTWINRKLQRFASFHPKNSLIRKFHLLLIPASLSAILTFSWLIICRDLYFTTVSWIDENNVMITWLKREQNYSSVSVCSPSTPDSSNGRWSSFLNSNTHPAAISGNWFCSSVSLFSFFPVPLPPLL